MVVCGYTTLNLDEKPENRSIPKVLVNKKDELIYISRSVIPGKKKLGIKLKYLKQVCIYAFSKKELNIFQSNKKSYLENIEDIEIIRFLEKGIKISMVKLNQKTYAVDTLSDLRKIKKYFN